VIVVVMAATAAAGDPPQFMKDTYPEQALKGAWEEYQAVWSPNGAIPVKQTIDRARRGGPDPV
jgi:hypothetical protein